MFTDGMLLDPPNLLTTRSPAGQDVCRLDCKLADDFSPLPNKMFADWMFTDGMLLAGQGSADGMLVNDSLAVAHPFTHVEPATFV